MSFNWYDLALSIVEIVFKLFTFYIDLTFDKGIRKTILYAGADDVLPVDYTLKGSISTWRWSKAESLSTPVCCTVSTTHVFWYAHTAAKHRRSARVRALLLRRRPSVCPSILFPLSGFSRQWSPGVDQVRTKIIESILKDEEGSLTFWQNGPNHRSPTRLCRHCWRCYRRWRLEHRQPACCRCQEGEAVKYSSYFPPHFTLDVIRSLPR